TLPTSGGIWYYQVSTQAMQFVVPGTIPTFYYPNVEAGQPLQTLTIAGPMNVAPATPTGVVPSDGSGMAKALTFTFTDTDGWQALSVLNVLINSTLDGRQACYVAFVPSGASSGSILLVDDAGDAGGPYSSIAVPGSGTATN